MEYEIDMLKEVGCIASAHGSTALSTILGKRIKLKVPNCYSVKLSELAASINSGKSSVAVCSRTISTLNGRIVFILDEADACKIASLSDKFSEGCSVKVITEMGMSVIKEVGTITAGAYVSAMSMLLKKLIILSPPTILSGTIPEIIYMALGIKKEESDQEIVVVNVEFYSDSNKEIKGEFFLLLSSESALSIQEECQKLLDSLE